MNGCRISIVCQSNDNRVRDAPKRDCTEYKVVANQAKVPGETSNICTVKENYVTPSYLSRWQHIRRPIYSKADNCVAMSGQKYIQNGWLSNSDQED